MVMTLASISLNMCIIFLYFSPISCDHSFCCGVLSHQLKEFVIDGNKVLYNVSSPDTRVDADDTSCWMKSRQLFIREPWTRIIT
ncbi:hypothetical protein DCAR_0415377 [Daucus carota subsp. sativus]|uniref:Uncharacterized protein n=1 Tax=Daucus carota subsp. sativus TaxID=79200 RepID=A0AAF1AWX6_DAUCS|nr:hypothetical protein DCAR_0415377 [Daucus carota subsp. sativus]